jgi:hypothetical protein
MTLGRTRFSIAALAALMVVVTGLLASSAAFAGKGGHDGLNGAITAPELPPRTDCALPASSPTLLEYGDEDSYFLAPGGSFEGATAADWYLAGGAQITTVQDPDRTTNGVLEIPSGGQAVSPVICVTGDCPHVRIFTRSVTGNGDVDFGVSYYKKGGWSKWKKTGAAKGKGKGKGWGLSGKLNIQPVKAKKGFQQVRFAFLAGGNNAVIQLDDLWVDPRASR